MVYRYEWVDESAELSPFGARHVMGLVSRLGRQPWQVVIEPSENAALDGQRRAALAEYFASSGVFAADSRVTIGFPAAEGLNGQEAIQLNRSYLRGGSRGGGSGGGFSGSSGSGTTGGFGGTTGGNFR